MLFFNKIAILLSSFFCCQQLSAQQQWRFISFNVSSGLSQNSVHCIYQDRDGLLWLGTQDGLNSFDGHNFTTYKHNATDSTTISDQFILSITEDANGFLWIGTRSGVNKLNKQTGKFTRHYFSAEEKNTVANSFQWFSKNNSGEIFIYDQSHPSIITNKSEIVNADTSLRHLRSCVFDSHDRIWSFNRRGELFSAEKKNNYRAVKISDAPLRIVNKSALCMIDKNDILWCYTQELRSKLFFYDINARKWLDVFIDLPSVISHINITAGGVGWISTIDGIYIIRDFKLSDHIAHEKTNVSGLSPGRVLCSYEDLQGNIWVGTGNAGFAYYNPVFDNFRLRPTGVQNDAVSSAVESGDTKWIGAASGLYWMNVHHSIHFFPNKRVTALTKDKAGNIWAAVENEGLNVLDQNGKIKEKFMQNDSLLQSRNVLYLLCDSKGRIIVCTERGFFVFEPATGKWRSFYLFTETSSPSGWYVLHAFEDSKKNIWLSKHLGIQVLDKDLNTIFHINSRETNSTISRTLITATTEDKKGVIWIATLSNGIYRYENGKLQQFTINEGLSSNVIYGIVCDEQGRLWTTTTSGINVYEPKENRFYILTSKDGLPADDFVLGALSWDQKKGGIFAGSSRGLIEIDATKIVLQKQVAAARISEVSLNGENIETVGKSIVVKPGYKTVGFGFSVKQALQPRNIIYQYRMKGSEEKWNIVPASNARINYSNLPFKTLTMQVRAAYSLSDLESAPIDEFSLIIKPAFWQTFTFKVIAALLIILTVALTVQQYNKAKYRRQLQHLELQKELQHERSRISRDLHDNIGAYTSALIAGINQLKNNEGKKEENIAELNDYASNIMGYLRETIWVLNNQRLTFTAFADRFKTYAGRIVKNYPGLSLRFHEEIVTERELSPQISLHLFRVMQEALQNACKHAEASLVDIRFFSIHKIQLEITDNGKGMNGEKRNDNYGLLNIRERVSEIGFNFVIESGSGVGTTVLLTEK